MKKQPVPTPKMAQSWQEASTDLRIRFVSPFTFEFNGKMYTCTGYLPDFGSNNGAVIAGRYDPDEVMDAAYEAGFYISGLSPYHYETYSREHFMDTLNDWGWFGEPQEVPPWFSGRMKSHGE
jgi:hypothetical protein